MAKKVDYLKQFIALRKSLEAERLAILAKLEKLNNKLTSMGCTNDRFYGPRTKTGRYRNFKSLRDTVLDVMAAHPEGLTRDEVLHHVLQAGYNFTTDDALNSLGVILYGRNPHFARDGKKFLPPVPPADGVQTADLGADPSNPKI